MDRSRKRGNTAMDYVSQKFGVGNTMKPIPPMKPDPGWGGSPIMQPGAPDWGATPPPRGGVDYTLPGFRPGQGPPRRIRGGSGMFDGSGAYPGLGTGPSLPMQPGDGTMQPVGSDIGSILRKLMDF